MYPVTLTLLIDLDNTLLGNSMATFIPAYLAALEQALSPYTDPSIVSSVLLAATEKMIRNNSPKRTLKEAFDPAFYPSLGISAEGVKDLLVQFYREKFPALEKLSQKRPEAIALIETALRRGWKIAIATNPIFPRAAILHRLNWAGIPDDKLKFSIIPSYESFHFAKPNPAFFAELLGRIGWPRQATVMVGDDPHNDIQGAQFMGIHTFWVSNNKTYPDGMSPPNAFGRLEEIIPWLDSLPEEELLPNYDSPTAIMGTMRGIPSALLGLTSNLTQEAWKKRQVADEWSLTEIACHLRDVENEINLARLKKIISEDNPFIPGVDSDAWALTRDYRSQDGLEALNSFVSTRIETLEILSNLAPADWKRPVQHAIFGPTNLAEIVSFMGGHDRLHVRQSHAQTCLL
jgi:HAD superfamily hydrolase (TIGR01549 family)